MKKSMTQATATFTTMPGTWKWIPTDSDWAVMPADEAAIKAVESMNATVERRMAHILIEVVSKSGKKRCLKCRIAARERFGAGKKRGVRPPPK